MHLFADCSRTVREMRGRPAPEQISSGRPPYEIPPTRARASQLRSLRNTHQRRTSSGVAGMRLVLQDIRNRSAYGIQADAVILDIHRFLRSPKVIQQQIEFLPGLRKDAQRIAVRGRHPRVGCQKGRPVPDTLRERSNRCPDPPLLRSCTSGPDSRTRPTARR